MKTKRAKATDIPMSVKRKVFERDKGRCIICGNMYNVMPNAHYISRAKGGLGIEENIVTLCTSLTKNKCHDKYDNGTSNESKFIHDKIKSYLKEHYDNWDESKLYYSK